MVRMDTAKWREKLGRLLLAFGSQKDVERLTELRGEKIGQNTISQILSGRIENPSWETVARISRAIGASMDFLADDALQEPPAPEVSDDERILLRLYRVMRDRQGMTLDDAIARLNGAGHFSHPDSYGNENERRQEGVEGKGKPRRA
jgi:transcriptional regulator with XRE-family HTH domain